MSISIHGNPTINSKIYVNVKHNNESASLELSNRRKRVTVKYSGISRFNPKTLEYIKRNTGEDTQLKLVVKRPGLHRRTVTKMPLKSITDIFNKVDDKDIYQRIIKVNVENFSKSELHTLHTLMPTYKIMDADHNIIFSAHPNKFNVHK